MNASNQYRIRKASSAYIALTGCIVTVVVVLFAAYVVATTYGTVAQLILIPLLFVVLGMYVRNGIQTVRLLPTEIELTETHLTVHCLYGKERWAWTDTTAVQQIARGPTRRKSVAVTIPKRKQLLFISATIFGQDIVEIYERIAANTQTHRK